MKLSLALLIFLLVFPSASAFASSARPSNASRTVEARRWTDDQAIQCILGESRGEIYYGQVAVAEVLRRRGGTLGFYGASSIREKDGHFYAIENGQAKLLPDKVVNKARKAWAESKTSDWSRGATHFEGDAFKRPYWSKGMILTAHIGSQQFFKEI